MRAPVKLVAFGALLVAAFGIAAAVGTAVGPIDTGPDSAHDASGHDASEDDGAPHSRPDLGGLADEQDGVRFVRSTDELPADTASPYSFTLETGGEALTQFDVLHERELHLVLVSRDFTDFHHVHPQRDAGGHWSVELPALAANMYRVYADFQPSGGERMTLGADLTVRGSAIPAPVLAPNTEVMVDGYDVRLDAAEATLVFEISREAVPVTPDQYLGAAAHLVAIRAADMGYLHVHPLEGTGGAIPFEVTFPTPGRYRLFLEFSDDGALHLAPFTIDVPFMTDVPATTEVDHGHDD